MTTGTSHLGHARQVADAVLYEGYLLYPYRGSARTNRSRFQFGVLMPPAYHEVDDREPSASQTECLLECPTGTRVTVIARFLHLRQRTVEAAGPQPGEFHEVPALTVAGREAVAWDEATECEERVSASMESLLDGGGDFPLSRPAGEQTGVLAGAGGRAVGRLVWRQAPLAGRIRLSAARLPGPCGGFRLRVRIENHTAVAAAPRSREDGLRHALIAAHALIWAPGGRFLSLTAPPEWAAPQAAACVNTATWPVLAGPEECRDLMLSSPVILYDHPGIAAESAGELFDSTEIDEILTLRTLALTDEEKREARATDPKAAALLDRIEHLPPEMLERMHGAIRYLGPTVGSPGLRATGPGAGPAAVPGPQPPAAEGRQPPAPPGTALPSPALTGTAPGVPWWEPGADTQVSPETDHVLIAGVRVARGSRVRMRPGARRADAQDLFLTGRIALVEAVLQDVDGNVHLAVVPEDDPAAGLQRHHGRFWYFAPDEVEPHGAPA